MEKIKITFLGTGFSVPTRERNHPAILVETGPENILIDCGEGTQRQFRKAGLNPCKLTKLLITHWHGDHILGIPGLLQTLALSGYNRTLRIYGPKGTRFFLGKMLEMFIFLGGINYEIHEVEGKFFENENFFLEAAQMVHRRMPANAYSLVYKDRIRLDKNKLKKLKLPSSPLLKELQKGNDIKINGKTIKAKDVTYEEKGRKLTIILDTLFNNEAIKLAKNSDLIISEATYSEEDADKAKENYHLTVKQAAKITKESGSKKLMLIHISERYKTKMREFEKEAKKFFKNTSIPNDLDIVEI